MKLLKISLCALALFVAFSCGNTSGSQAAHSSCGNCTGEGAGDCSGHSECVAAVNPVIENIMSRRSIRNYKDTAVSREVMSQILECGINAPNGQNKQSWEVRVVDSPEIMNDIKEAMSAGGYEAAAGCFRGAPVMVFIARDKAYDFSTIDCGLLAENMVLAANSLGVGSICLGSPVRFIENSPKRDEILSRLSFSPGYELCLCVGFGYANEAPAAKPRNFEKVKFVD